jgi:hypothetical protein
MRKDFRASAISIILGAGLQCFAADDSAAQNARDFMNVFGAIMQSAMVQATQAEWRKLPPESLSCVDEALRQRGINVQALIGSGIAPSDGRISDVVANCRSQRNLQQLANTGTQSSDDRARTNYVTSPNAQSSRDPSKYKVEKVPLGSILSFDSAAYREYQCKPSDQFPGFTRCEKQRAERVARGAYLSSSSMVHAEDGRVFYLNRYLEPAFFDPGEVDADISRLSRAFGEQPHSVAMPQRAEGTVGVIAYWGDVVLEPLNATATASLASGNSAGGMLVDFLGNFRDSVRQNLPVYRVAGGPGFVWAESHDINGRGRLRFFAIDASALAAPIGDGREAKAYALAPPAPDPWKECQSSDADIRLAGCTKVIEAKGLDRIRLADAFDGRCSAYNQKGQFQPALADCKTAIDLNPRYSYAYANLGATYLGLNDPASAIPALDKAVALKSNFVWSRLSRAKALEASGAQNEDALQEYQYAFLIDPSNQVAKDGLLKLMVGSASSEEASASCLGDINGQAQYIAVRATASNGTAAESAVSTISATVQSYRDKLPAQMSRVDQLARAKESLDKQQAVLIGSSEDRKKIMADVQRLTEAESEAKAKLEALTEREDQLRQAEATSKERARLKEIRQELAKLRPSRAATERNLHQRTSEREDALSKAHQKAVDIAKGLVESERLAVAKENAESCVRQIKTSIVALEQKASEIRQQQYAQAARAAETNAQGLLSDLSEFAQRNSNLVPLEVGPLVAALKGAIGAKDPEKVAGALSTLQRRLDEIPEFKGFRTSREEARRQVAAAELDQLADTARTISEFVESYARRNITSDSTQDLVKLRGRLSEALVTPEAESLKLAISTSERELEGLHLESEYRDFRAKHPIRSRNSVPATTEHNRLLVEGPLDETLLFVNETGRAGVVRNIRGDLVFDSGKASLCFLHENSLDPFGMSELKRRVLERGARSVDVSTAACTAANLTSYDILVVNRGLFSTLSNDTQIAMLSAVDKGELTVVAVISERDLQTARNEDSIRSLQLENDILKKPIEGFGLVSIANGTSVVCQTVADRERAHEELLDRASDRLQVEIGSPRVISTSVESAFVSAKRGQCGAIYGASKDLRELVLSLQRDKIKYHVMPIWFSSADVEAEQKEVAGAEIRKLREEKELEQKRKDDQYRRDQEKKQTETEKRQHQEVLRRENGVLARGLQEMITEEVKEFATTSEADDKTYVNQRWPALATWYREKIRGAWELENIGGELRDYGSVKWKNRVLEAGFVEVTFKMKHRELGEHQQKCFLVGYLADREFAVPRDPISVPCEDGSAVSRYKIAHEFASKWIAN